MMITNVSCQDVPMALLLEADPSLERIKGYLHRSYCYVATLDGVSIGAYVVQPFSPEVHELMNIAVTPDRQNQGIGSVLLRHAVDTSRERGARRLEVGTGTFGHQLAYYQRQGFRVFNVERDYFLRHYPEPIYENGIQHKDMLRLVVEF